MTSKKFSETVQNFIYTVLSVIFVFGVTGVSFVYGWISLGPVWGTIAAVLFLFILGLILQFPVDYFRDKWTKEVVKECVLLVERQDKIELKARERLVKDIHKYFGVEQTKD